MTYLNPTVSRNDNKKGKEECFINIFPFNVKTVCDYASNDDEDQSLKKSLNYWAPTQIQCKLSLRGLVSNGLEDTNDDELIGIENKLKKTWRRREENKKQKQEKNNRTNPAAASTFKPS